MTQFFVLAVEKKIESYQLARLEVRLRSTGGSPDKLLGGFSFFIHAGINTISCEVLLLSLCIMKGIDR